MKKERGAPGLRLINNLLPLSREGGQGDKRGEAYRDELNDKGYTKFVDELNQGARAAEVLPLTLCEKLDNIKSEVEESLRERLEEFDCAAQAYKPSDDS